MHIKREEDTFIPMNLDNVPTHMLTSKLVRVNHPVYKWASIGPTIWVNNGQRITVPAGFLSDGMTGSPFP